MKDYFLRGTLGIYIIAFTSLYTQVKVLFGEDGIVPIKDYLKKNSNSYNVISLAPKIGLTYGAFLEALCLLAIVSATLGLFLRRGRNILLFAFLWYVFFSLHQVGQGFMNFNCDLLLLEVGFLAALLSPLLPKKRNSEADHDHLTRFLVKWLASRWYITYVCNLYFNGSENFYKLNAFNAFAPVEVHVTPLHWYVYNLPSQYQALLQLMVHSVAISAPFLLFVDLKYCRQFAFHSLLYISIFLQVINGLGWDQIAIIVCLAAIFKESYSHRGAKAKQSTVRLLFDLFILIGYMGLIAHVFSRYFGATYNKSVLNFKPNFNQNTFKLLLTYLIPTLIVLGVYSFIKSLYKSVLPQSRKTPVLKTLLYVFLASVLFIASIPTLTKYEPNLDRKITALGAKDVHKYISPLRICNSYWQPFSDMSSDGRLELVVESKETASEKAWDQFHLKYAPSENSLNLVAPHIPRIHLKLYYALKSTIDNNQWIKTLVYKLATQNKDVIKLVAPNSYIAKSSLVRVGVYSYKLNKKTDKTFDGYWSHPKFIREYMAPIDTESLKQSLKASGVSIVPPKPAVDNTIRIVETYLDISSDYARGVHQEYILCAVIVVVMAALAMRS